MPQEQQKNTDKKKHDPKEQRKPRQPRNQAGKSDKKAEKDEESKSASKVTDKVPHKPVYENPGPEFYNNLKRETEEIVKITEAENAKYRKKEIQSNWAKYEMPIESYEDVDDQDIGADYEKLIQAPLSAGGHFQFKHEKSWDTSSAPSLYDRYFEINMDSLATAIQTIPFYERNEIDQSEFSEIDLLTMNQRATKYKQKYYNDNLYATPEMEAQEIILKSLVKNSVEKINSTEKLVDEEKYDELDYEVNLDFNAKNDSVSSLQNTLSKVELKPTLDDFDDEFLFKEIPDNKITEPKVIPISSDVANRESNVEEKAVGNKNKDTQEHPVASKVTPVIQSPEELEKWLDDFLDS